MADSGVHRSPSVTLLGDLSFQPVLDEALRLSGCQVRTCEDPSALGPDHVGSLVVVDGDAAMHDSMRQVRAIHSLPAFESTPVLLLAGQRGGMDAVLDYEDGPVEVADGQIGAAPLALRFRALATLTRSGQQRLEHDVVDGSPTNAVSRLAGGVAHDFNNILSVITTLSDLLLRLKAPDDPDREDLEEIFQSAQRGSEITRQLSSFSRTGRGDPEALDMNDVLRANEKMLRRCVGDDISLVLALDSAVGAVWADPIQIEQMILHLTLNASDAIQGEGSVRITTSRRTVDTPLRADTGTLAPGDYVVLEVIDTGEGIDAETRHRLFEPFFTTRGWGRNSGLGLSVVFGAVEKAGGRVQVESTVGKGAIFRVFLPRHTESADSDEPVLAVGAPVVRGAGETLLVVEDHDELRRGLCRLFEEAGYRVVPAGDGAAAQALMGNEGVRPHLVLSDVVMPGMGGGELERRVRSLGLAVPFLFFSGHPDHVEVDRLRRAGVRVVAKPLDLQRLQGLVRDRLDAAAERRP